MVAEGHLPQAIDLLAQLNADLPRRELERRLREIFFKHPHYELYGAYDGETLVGVCGAWVATKVWCGRYLEVDNIVVAQGCRSVGVGTFLLNEMENLARERGCEVLVLDSYTSNHASHRLYHRLGYEIKGFHFIKAIGETVSQIDSP